MREECIDDPVVRCFSFLKQMKTYCLFVAPIPQHGFHSTKNPHFSHSTMGAMLWVNILVGYLACHSVFT